MKEVEQQFTRDWKEYFDERYPQVKTVPFHRKDPAPIVHRLYIDSIQVAQSRPQGYEYSDTNQRFWESMVRYYSNQGYALYRYSSFDYLG